jgi:polyphosphate glucokinase
MKILAIDVGGTHVKVRVSDQPEWRKAVSGPTMTAPQMVEVVNSLVGDWTYDVVSLGYPGPVANNAPVREPVNLGTGWVGFDYGATLARPTKIVNDAAMQALGSYTGGRMLFVGLGTGLGLAMVVEGVLVPLELGHVAYKGRRTYEELVDTQALRRVGKKRWRREVAVVLDALSAALLPDYMVIGGGNADLLKELPPNARLGDNENAFIGGFRLWESARDLTSARGHALASVDGAAWSGY